MIGKKKVYLILVALLILASALTACADSSLNLEEFISPDGSFSIGMPGVPEEMPQVIDTEVGPIDLNMYFVEFDRAAYFVAYSDYPADMVAASDLEDILDGARDGAVSNVDGFIDNETRISLNGYPGRELVIKSNDGTLMVRAQIFMIENRLFQILLIVETPDGFPEDMDAFFNSFKLLK